MTAPLQTDRLSYSFEADGRGFYTTPIIELVLTNTSGAPAFLMRGDRTLEVILEGFESGEWIPRYSKNFGDPFGPVLRLDPDASVAFETTIEGFLPGTCECRPIINLEDGLYRFHIFQGYVDSYDENAQHAGEELPEQFRVSNPFALDVPG